MKSREILTGAAAIAVMAIVIIGTGQFSLALAEEGASAENASAFVERLGNRAVRLYAAVGDEHQRIAAIREIVRENVDLERIGRFVLGPSWQEMSAVQREQYLTVYREYALNATTWQFSGYRFVGFHIVASRPIGNDDALVETLIEQSVRPIGVKEGTSDPPPVIVDWRVAREAGQYKIVDVVIEGVSLALAQRREFVSIIENKGMDGLFALLGAREAALRRWAAEN